MTMHSKGLLLTALGVLFLSPDALLIRLVDMEVWNLAVWRGLLQAIGLTLLVAAFYGRRAPLAFWSIGASGVVIAVVFSGSTLTFLAALQHTEVANVLVILASAPIFAALMSLALLKEPVAPRTWIAIVVIFAGIGLIMWDGLGRGTGFGDAMAVATAILLAGKITMLRHQRHINMIPALALSGAVFAGFAAMAEAPTLPSGEQTIWLLLMGFAVVTPAAALITLGPRYISAPEVSLLMLLETVLGPLWVWLVIHETPTPLAIVGGAIVVTALIVHSAVGLRRVREERAA
jgi:drug/metabolite transporter (DMT)-like permease